jgi:hypothetical protein
MTVMKRALLVGIDTYDRAGRLGGCVNDVNALHPLLARNEDDSPNFICETRTSDTQRIDRRSLLEDLDILLRPGADTALLYFAGHGAAVENDVVLVTQDGFGSDLGVPLSTILAKVQVQGAPREVLIVLDCCFGGAAGGVPQLGGDTAALRSGVSILTASRGDQTAAETTEGRGAFSTYLCGALDGGAADVIGRVTVSSVYAYLSECFGPWDQRPTFKANVDRLHDLRLCSPAVPLPTLRRLPEFFPDQDYEFPLDPSYEPTEEPRHPEHEAIFGELQKCRAVKLVEPVGEEHMYYAAMYSKACRLTPLGRLYWRMAAERRI